VVPTSRSKREINIMKMWKSIKPIGKVDIQKRNRKESSPINIINCQITKMNKRRLEQRIFKTNRRNLTK
jgi:hypothetical protein